MAVRGERLELHWSRWSDDAENEATYLHVCEIDDDGRISYDSRFEEDDFESAYRELDRRYYAGEGAAFAESGATATEYAIALNQGNFDRVFGELLSARLPAGEPVAVPPSAIARRPSSAPALRS